MERVNATMSVPLTQWEDGSIRVSGSRVPIDTIIYHFDLGATAEEINYKFPSLQLADIYGTIHYYLTHREEVKEYLRQQEAEADSAQQRIESEPGYQRSTAEMRERLLARWDEKQKLGNTPAAD